MDGGDYNIPFAFLKMRGDNKIGAQKQVSKLFNTKVGVQFCKNG